jgi:hypothetical protein
MRPGDGRTKRPPSTGRPRGSRMKRLLLVPMVFLVLAEASAADRLLLLSVQESYLNHADPRFREIYGRATFYPEFAAGIRLVKGLHLMGSYGRLVKDGKTPDLGLETRSTQKFLAAELGYIGTIRGSLGFLVEAGLASLTYREDALEAWISGRTPGIKTEVGLLYMAEKGRVFMGLKAGYMFARVNEHDIRLGGGKVAVCLGVRILGKD